MKPEDSNNIPQPEMIIKGAGPAALIFPALDKLDKEQGKKTLGELAEKREDK